MYIPPDADKDNATHIIQEKVGELDGDCVGNVGDNDGVDVGAYVGDSGHVPSQLISNISDKYSLLF